MLFGERFAFPSQNPKLLMIGPTTGPYPQAIARISMSVTSSSSRRPFGKPENSPASSPSRFPVPTGGAVNCVFRRSRSAFVSPREVQRRNAGEQHGDEIAAPARGRVVEDRVEAVHEARELGIRVPVRELAVLARIGRVPVVLLPDRDDDLVDERVAEPRDLDQRPVGVERPVTAEDPDLRPACAGVDPDRPVRERSLEQIRLRNLDRDRVRRCS